MAINLSDNISLSAPKPLRTTDLVGFGQPVSTYTNKEAIPSYMRYLYMETIDQDGRKWTLKNPLDILDWSLVPDPIVGPTYDGEFIRVKLQNYEDWQPLPSIIPEPTTDGDWVRKKAGTTYTWELAGSGGGGDVYAGQPNTFTDLNNFDIRIAANAGMLALGDITTSGNITTGMSASGNSVIGFNYLHPTKAFSYLYLDNTVDELKFEKYTGDQYRLWTEDNFNPDSKEDDLGVPGADNRILSSLIDGTRSWVDQQYTIPEPMLDGDWVRRNTAGAYTWEQTVILGDVEDITYADLKAKHLAGTFLAAKRYRITDFKSQWIMDILDSSTGDFMYSGSPAAAIYNYDTAIEPIIVTAVSSSEISRQVSSDTYPSHIIFYNPRWDWTEAGAVTQPTGYIYYRENPQSEISAGFDYIGYRATRFALTAPVYDPGTTYNRLKTCSVYDPNGDALYICLKDGTVGQDPSVPANDGVYWALFRPAGADTSGMYRDYLASDWTDGSGNPVTDMTQTNSFGFQVDDTRFQNFVTFGLLGDITNPTGEITGSTYEFYTLCHVESQNNVFLATSNTASSYANYLINCDLSVRGITMVSSFFYQVSMKDMYAGTPNNYFFGLCIAISVANTASWMSNNYIEGMSFITDLGTTAVNASLSNNILIRKGASRTSSGSRGLNGTHFAGANNIIYKTTWTHANIQLLLDKCTVLGEITYNNKIALSETIIEETADIRNNTIWGNGLYTNGVSGINAGNIFKGNVHNCHINELDNSIIEGDLEYVTGHDWLGVTIPSNVSLKYVDFEVPTWLGLNTWSGNPLDIQQVNVGKRYVDSVATPTLEKFWYQTIDVNGVSTDVELT